MGGRALEAHVEEAVVARPEETRSVGSPAIELLDALRRGDDLGVVAVCGDSTRVSTDNMPWSCSGRDEIQAMLVRARERFPGLTFESRTRHVGFGLVIEEARVRDIRADDDASRIDAVSASAALRDEVEDEAGPEETVPRHVDESVHPMYDEPATRRSTGVTPWRDRSLGGPAAPLNMPVRVTVRHDDLQVHEVTLSFPAALLKRALGLHVDPLEMSLSEVQSAFIAPVGAGFTTHALARPELHLVPPVPVDPEPADAPAETEPPRRRRRRWVALLVALVAVAAAGGWWFVQGRPGAQVADTPAPTTTPAPVASLSPSTQPSTQPSTVPSSQPSSSQKPTVTHAKPANTPTRKPNVTLKSDLAFGFNSARLSPAAKTAIDQVARQVRQAGLTGKIYVEGYTDNLGSSAYGQLLSQRRADAVSTYLQSQLVGAPVSIVSTGHGEADPVASNATAAGRKANRRVTITLPTS
jgi:outer membrane protein OmpA-like peptidoglycan-associated protein